MPNTYTLIASYTATGAVSSIDFSSIPSTYTDLVLRVSASTNASGGAAANGTNIKFNGSTANRTYRRLEGSGSGASSDSGSNIPAGGINGTSASSYFTNQEIYIPNYSGSSSKSVGIDSVTENNGTTTATNLIAGLWSSSSAINQITVYPDAGSFVTNSTAYLYGIKNS